MIALLLYLSLGTVLAASLVFDNEQVRMLPKWDRLRFVLIIIGIWPFAVLAILVNAVMEDQ